MCRGSQISLAIQVLPASTDSDNDPSFQRYTVTTVNDFIEQFLIAVDFQDPVEVTPETVLVDLPEWDSLAALGVIVMFDIEYGKTIIGDDLKQSITIQDLFNLLSR